MVDYPTAAPVLAFVGPASPDDIAEAARAASDAMERIFKPSPRKLQVARRMLRRGLLRGPQGAALGLITDMWREFWVDNLAPAGRGEEYLDSNGWTLVADCSDHNICCNGCNGQNGSKKKNRWWGNQTSSHACCATSPAGAPLADGITVAGHINAVDLGYKKSTSSWIGWHLWYERPASLSGTVPIPNYKRPLRWRERARLRPSAKVSGAGRTRAPSSGGTTVRRPAPRNERERKARHWGAGAFPFRWLLEGALEGCDAIEAVHKALPGHLQDRSGTCAGMSRALFRHFGAVDVGEALENLVDEQLEDMFFGMFGEMTKKEARALARPRGLQARPATKYGGWTPCIFCN